MAERGSAPLEGAELLLADLDGVVYRGPRAIAYAVESINAAPCRVGYITNNASRTPESVAGHLNSFGLSVAAPDVVTSAQAGVRLLAGLVPSGATVLVVGGEGLVAEAERAGFAVTASADDAPAGVVQGFSPELGWRQLAEAAFALALDDAGEGIPWVATNMDWSIPVARGVAPGNGTLVSAVHSAVGRMPVVAGKPEVAIFEEAFDRFGTRRALFVGDRLDTDILGARRAGIPSAMVLTGIDRAKQLLAARADMRPDFILEDLRQLQQPYPVTTTKRDGSRIVGRARVRVDGNRVEIVAPGDRGIDLLRAACAAIWDSGLGIHALEVPASLYS